MRPKRRQRAVNLPRELQARLDSLGAKVRNVEFLRASGQAAIVAACGLALALALDYCFDLGLACRLGLLAIEMLLVGGGAWWAFVRPWRREYSPEALATLVERSHPELKERLVSIVSLCSPNIPEAERGSHLMRDLLLRQTLRSIEDVDFRQSVPGERQGRWALCGLLAWAILLVPALVAPTMCGLLMQRFFSPWSNLERAGSIALHVQPGDVTVARGADVAFTAVAADGNAALKPRLEWVDAGGGVESRPMEWDADGRAWRLKVPHVFRGLTYHIAAERTRTRDYQLDVADPPAIAALKLVVQPPSYTGQAAEEIDGLIGEATMLAGSELEWQFTFSKPLANAAFSFTPAVSLDADPAAPVPAPHEIALTVAEDRQSAVARMTADESGTFAMHLVDDAGLTNSDPDRRIVVKPDLPPEISLEGSDEPQEVQPSDVFPIVGTARDDVGVAAVELHVEGPRGLTQVIPLAGPALGRRSVEASFRLSLSAFELSDGDELHYRVRAADGRAVPAPQEAWSEVRTLRVNSQAAPPQAEQLAQEQGELEQRLAELRQEITEHQAELTNVQRAADASARKNRPFEQNEKLPALSEHEQNLAQKLEQLAAAFGEHPLYANVSDRIAEVGAKEVATAQSHVERATGEPILEKSADLLRAADQIAAAEAKLKGVADDFQKLAKLERDLLELNRLGDQTRELSQKTRELSEQQSAASPNETSAEGAAREQEVESQRADLAQRRDDLAQRLNDLLEKHPELVGAAQQAELDQLAELGKRAQELAATEEQLARTQQQETREAAEKAAPVARNQDELARKAEAAAKSDSADPSAAARINPEELQQALEALEQGNLGEATAAQKEAADQLRQLAQERKREAESNPAAAETAKQAAELAKQQAQLQQDLARAQHQPPDPGSHDDTDTANAQKQAAKSDVAEKQVQELAQAQAKLAQDAQKLAQQAADKFGEKSSAAQRASEAAASSAQACKNCQGGSLGQAAESGRNAASAGEQAAREMNFAAGQSEEAKQAAQAAAKLAQQQADLASKMETAASDSAAQSAATRQAQQRVAQSTEQIAQALQQAAERMGQQLLSQPQAGQQATQAQQAASEAQQALEQAQAARQRQDFGRATQSSQQAAQALREAASQAQRAGSQSAPTSPVPRSVGQQVAQAAHALHSAQAPLAPPSQGDPTASNEANPASPSPQGEPTSNSPMPSTPSSNANSQANATPASQPGEGKPGEGKPGEGKPGEGKPGSGQGSPGQSSSGTASATAQPGQGQPSSAAGQPGQPGGNGGGVGRGALAAGARQLELASQALNAAAQQLQVRTGRPGQSGPRQPSESGPLGEGAAPAEGEPMPLEAEPQAPEIVRQLDAEVQKLSGRRWGELPGHLRTEILQSASKKPNSDYSGLIKAYFKEIARPQRQGRPEGRLP